jgi:hypothetical protein
MEEVSKLTSNPEALEKWLNKFAEEKGIKAPNVNKEKLDNIPEEVKPEKIQEEGKALQERVEGKLNKTRNVIHDERDKLRKYQTPTVSPQLSGEDMFKLKEEEFRLNFGSDPSKDPRFINHANKAQEWFKNQQNPYERFGSDVWSVTKWAGRFAINLGEKAIDVYNAANQANEHIKVRSLNKP